MSMALTGDKFLSQTSSRSWRSGSLREIWNAPSDVFETRSSRRQTEEIEDDELKLAAIERLPTYDRMRRGILNHVMRDGRVVHNKVIDVTNLGNEDKTRLMETVFKAAEEDNERFLRRIRARSDRVGIDIPEIEKRNQNLSMEGDAHDGIRALPTVSTPL